MSRNLGRTDCDFCGGLVTLDEKPRPITREEAGPYYETHQRLWLCWRHLRERDLLDLRGPLPRLGESRGMRGIRAVFWPLRERDGRGAPVQRSVHTERRSMMSRAKKTYPSGEYGPRS